MCHYVVHAPEAPDVIATRVFVFFFSLEVVAIKANSRWVSESFVFAADKFFFRALVKAAEAKYFTPAPEVHKPPALVTQVQIFSSIGV